MRDSWNKYLMNMAIAASKRGTCDRAQVGAVLTTEDHRVISTGYNGSPGSGGHHCDADGHIIVNGSCVATTHAEQNVIADCAKHGKSMKDSIMYVTHFPCLNCVKSIIPSGIKSLYVLNLYRVDKYALELLYKNDIRTFMYNPVNDDLLEMFPEILEQSLDYWNERIKPLIKEEN